MYFFFRSPHLLRGTSGQKSVEVTDILFDAGFESREEAMSYGVLPGDTIVPYAETIKTANGRISSANRGTTAMAVQWY